MRREIIIEIKLEKIYIFLSSNAFSFISDQIIMSFLVFKFGSKSMLSVIVVKFGLLFKTLIDVIIFVHNVKYVVI